MRYLSFLLLSLLLISCNTEEKTNTKVDRSSMSLTEKAQRVTIIRDDFGVPHIYGKTDADAVFGLLYAQCEDDFNRVEQNYIWATGRLAEVEGEEAIYSDLRAKLFMTEEEAKDNYDKSPNWLKELCDAFADGINYYLKTHPEVTPRLLTHFEPWMPMYFSEGSIGGDIERIATRKIKAFYESAMEIPRMEALQLEKEKEMAEPQGSNGIAIAGDLTQSGNALLLINPHTSFYFRGEVHVVSEEGLNAYGAVTWGQFFVYQGFNEKTGWMHTSTYTDVLDEFKEKIFQFEGSEVLNYQYGDEVREVKTSEITLSYKAGDSLKTKTFPAYRTHHGPITHRVDGMWTASAMMWEPVKALEQSFIRTKQVPKRDTVYDYTKPVEGWNPKTDWKGLHPVDENILVKNPPNGWIQNCNSTPFTSAGPYSPKKEDYPNYMSRNQENFRGVHAIQLLTDRKGYTLDSLIQLAHDPYLPAFNALIPGLLKSFDHNDDKNPKLRAAIETLEQWDHKTSKESVAMTLAHFYGTRYYQEGEYPEGMTPMERVAFWGSEAGEQLKIFEKTIDQLVNDFGTWEIPWGEVNRYQRLNGDIRQQFDDSKPSIPVGFASGRWGALAAYGASYTTEGVKKLYGTRGNSFVAAVEFGDKVKAKTILAGGQSGDPNSPHFDDQIARYANVAWKNVPYYKEDVLKVAKETYRPGER